MDTSRILRICKYLTEYNILTFKDFQGYNIRLIKILLYFLFILTVTSQEVDICRNNKISGQNIKLHTPYYPDWFSPDSDSCSCQISAEPESNPSVSGISHVNITILHEQWHDRSECLIPLYFELQNKETKICPSSRKSEKEYFEIYEDDFLVLRIEKNNGNSENYFRISAEFSVTGAEFLTIRCFHTEGVFHPSDVFAQEEPESTMSAAAIAAGVVVVVVVIVIVLVCCGYCVYRYFWKNKKQKGEGGGGGGDKKEKDVEHGKNSTKQNTKINANGHNAHHYNNRSAGKPPSLNLAQVNLAFDKAYDPQSSFDPEVPNSANSSLSNNEWPNKSYSYDQSQSESAGTSDSEFDRHHLSSSTEHSRKSIRFADHLPTMSGDKPPEDGRTTKIARSKVTLIPPPAPRGKMPLPIIEVSKSQLKRKGSGRGGHPRISMDPMPSNARVQRKHSSGSRSASVDNSRRGASASPHRRQGSGRRTSSRSPHRNSGRRARSNDSAHRHHNDSSSQRPMNNEDRYSGSSFDSNLSADVFVPDVSQNTQGAPKQSPQDYSMGMHPGMSAPDASKNTSQPFTHLVAGNSGIQTQQNTPAAESQNFERNTQQRRSRSRKRRPRNVNDSDSSITRDIVSGTGPVGDVDSPPNMLTPGYQQPQQQQQSHASPLAQSSPQTQRSRKPQQQQQQNSLAGMGQQSSFDSYTGEVRMPYDYYPPGSPGDALSSAGKKNKTPRNNAQVAYQPEAYRQDTKSRKATTPRSPLYGDKISDPDSNYFSGSSGGDRLGSDTNSPFHAAPGGPLVFQGVENPAFENNEYSNPAPSAVDQNKPKKRRRKSQNRGKNTAGSSSNANHSGSGYNNSVQNVQPSGTYRPQVGAGLHEFSNDSLIYMDFATDTDIYAISSKKAAKSRQSSGVALSGGKSGETEL